MLRQVAARLSIGPQQWTTATLISPTLAVTPRHALASTGLPSRPTTPIQVEFPGVTTAPIPAIIRGRDAARDVAVIELGDRAPVPSAEIRLGENNPRAESTWHTLAFTPGHPDGAYAQGSFGGILTLEGRPFLRLLVTDGPSIGPADGAPVVIDDRIFGIVARAAQGDRPEWYAIPITDVAIAGSGGLVLQIDTAGSPDLDEAAFFARLSPSSHTALAHADAMRRWNSQDRVHMEHLVMGLYEKIDGPTQRLLHNANINETSLRGVLAEAVELRLPATNEYTAHPLNALPPHSPHVRAAFIAARRAADEHGSERIQSRHLLYGALSVEECSVTRALLQHVRKSDIDLGEIPSVDLGPPIAGYSADTAEGTDQLDIRPDVEALCSVLVARDVPLPISVGLFGNWGSGKSFFMGRMNDRINLLKRAVRARGGEGAYCGNVVQIWFNAWHYMDTNLWASLGAEIFEALAKEIDRDAALAAGHGDPVQVRARLLAAAASSRDVLAEAERAKGAAEDELRTSEERLKHLAQTEVEAASNLRPAALAREVYRIAVQQPEIGARMQEAAKALGLPTARAAATDLKAQLLELSGIVGYARGTLLYLRERPGARRLVLGVMALGAATALLLPRLKDLPVDALVAQVTGWLLAAGGLLAPVLRYVRPAMRLLKGAREAHQAEIDKARDQAQAEATAQHRQVQQKVEQAQQRVEAAATALKEVERQLDALRADRQLADFVRERQASSDYTKHLGIVARARRDFQQLSDLLGRVQAEAGAPVAPEPGVKPPEPVASIDRIVLYIDDLDRCPESKVFDVLQAVHLLLAFPLFVVVVGVDPRWLVHSLKQHARAFQTVTGGESDEEQLLWQSTPLNYLEKIFQIPFTLRPMGRTGFGNMIDDLSAERSPRVPARGDVVLSPPPPPPPQPPPEPGDEHKTVARVPLETVKPPPPTPLRDAVTVKPEPATPPPEALMDLNPRHLRFEEWELRFMKHLHPLIPSPRAAKRFMNIYRLLRASLPQQRLKVLVGDADHGEYCVVQLLLAIQTGYPRQAADVLRRLIETRPTEAWWTFLDSFGASGTPSEAADDHLEAETWRELLERLKPLREKISADESCKAFTEWAPFVARYSFQSGRALTSQWEATPAQSPPPPLSAERIS